MALFKVQTRIVMTSGVPKDAVTNSWCVQADNRAAGILFCDQLKVFYNAVSPQYPALVAQNGHETKMYDLDDPEPRVPTYVESWNLTTAPTGAPLPNEIAACVSFQGTKISGSPQARRRGRVFIGPLDAATVDTTGRFGTILTNGLRTAAQNLLISSSTAGSWEWGIHSPLSPGQFVPIVNGWVDNAPDVQRRRGTLSNARSIFP